MDLHISDISAPLPDQNRVEIVERKGLGHPDTLCDSLAEALSRALCRHYRDRFGQVLHHNVDKALLWGGAAAPAFGGGQVTQPITLYLAGRAASAFMGESVPVAEIAEHTVRDWLATHMHALDPERHVVVRPLIRPGSPDLVELFSRQQRDGVVLANDTSFGVGFWPLSQLEQVVLEAEALLNSHEIKKLHPELGEDVKILGIRRDAAIELTVACALIDRHVADLEDYAAKKARIVGLVHNAARRHTHDEVAVHVNAADAGESVYLTVTGTSAEGGDDGQVGRGNRANGLITPFRPMTLEAVAGKNPISHVGKLYNLIAVAIAREIVETIEAVQAAQCFLVSRIGDPVKEPQLAEIGLSLPGDVSAAPLRPQVEAILRRHLDGLDSLWRTMLDQDSVGLTMP